MNEEMLSPIQDCAICGGQTTLRQASYAEMTLKGTKRRLYYHQICLTKENKAVLEEKLKNLVKESLEGA
jgi:hypothetical protein